ncbi:hypothetical protein PFICI_11816 [Pestalotiopsis fici W106-1]|uniref:LysM domain-containing protein n=1 Tax=Pestalotiopsis fici (strain W106-1 / CGMCC3.15140) TaxID=1229662 RepID=W3WRG3_PESFW|nr:uncharacterized protein PFICI_11816 [Pestalotiopsis fici W106-1]ETS76429.1 hypothetical protein PFICI_11816 [Pestalotiopsis fici W106-1]
MLSLILLLLATLSHAQVQLLNVSANDGTSSTCITVLNSQVTCDNNLVRAGDTIQGNPVFGTPLFLTSAQLASLCTTSCSSSLSGWERRVAGACGATLYDQPDGGKAAPAALVQNYIELFDSLCLKNSAGQYCNDVIGKALAVDPSNGMVTGTPASTILCDDCYLSLVSTQLAMPMASTSILADDFKFLTSSCSKTGWTLSSPPTATTFTTRPTVSPPAAANCSGEWHTITASDTCTGISLAEGISTDDLARSNTIPSFCYNFPTSGDLCIPSDRKCQPYLVKSTDTCYSLQKQFGIQYAQLISWNPTLGPKCNNIDSIVGYVICATTPGGGWVNPNPQPSMTTTWSTGTPLWTASLTPMSAYPSATYVANTTAAPYATDTRMDCITYITSPILTNYTGNGTTSLACEDVASQYGISTSDFVDWNPSLNSSDPCTMAVDTQYCAQTYAKVSQNIVGACTELDIVPAGYDCAGFASSLGLELDRFKLWNPELDSDCSNFKVGTQYCVAVAHYKQPGIISTCNKFATPNNTNWALNPCQILETEFGLGHARFVAWNPAVLNNCTGLYQGYDYCVSIPNFTPVYTTTTSATVAALVAQATTASSLTDTSTSNVVSSTTSLPRSTSTTVA